MRSIMCLFVLCSVASASDIGGLKDLKAESSFKDIIIKIEMMEQKKITQNVTVKCDVKIGCIKDGEAKNYDLSSTIQGFASGQLRIKVNYGIISVMDLGITATKAILLFESNAYVGTVQEAKDSTHVSKLAATELAGNKFLFPEIWDERASSRILSEENGQPVVYVFRRQEGKEEVLVIKKVFLIKFNDDYVVSKVVRYSENMQVCGIIEYEDYKKCDVEVKKGKRAEVIPSKVTVKTDCDTTFAFTVNKVKLDDKEDPKDAIVHVPDNVTPKPFSDLDTGHKE